MLRTVPILTIKDNLNRDLVPNPGAGSHPYGFVKIQVKTSITGRHQINFPRLIRKPVDSNKYRHWLAPIFAQLRGPLRTKKYVRVYASNFYDGGKSQHTFTWFPVRRNRAHDLLPTPRVGERFFPSIL